MKKVAHQFFEDDGLDYEDMLSDFDSFCDQFEDRASNAYHKGDQNNGRVTKEIERAGTDAPMAVREVEQLGISDGEIGQTIIDVSPSDI
jgi:hypothetical protein|tara:strand:- start:4178 stop:4444 length:267 start_codon:yes stop_codon:yes gene_type:complete